MQSRGEDRAAELRRCAGDAVHWFNNWLWTYDPRLISQKDAQGKRMSPYVPFKLFPKQAAFVNWLVGTIAADEEGLCEKSRDAGVSYLCAGVALHHWLFVEGFKATFGSRKVDYVDKKDNPDSIFEKLRIMLRRLPDWMLPPGFSFSKHDSYLKLVNPATGAMISGEGGDDMGRGGRSSLYVLDEAAFVPNAEGVEKALSGNTDCIVWVSSVNGMGNLFARKRWSILKPHQIFRLHWRDDPRKTEEWAAKKKASYADPTGWASEYDIDYTASLEGVCIPAAWVESAKRLAALDYRVTMSNSSVTGLDVGAGKAKSVAIVRRGPVVRPPYSRGDPDTIGTAHWGMQIAKANGSSDLNYDAIGVGEGVKSAFAHMPPEPGAHLIRAVPVNVGMPPSLRQWADGRRSAEMFSNLKAELWWLCRTALQKSHENVLAIEGHEDGVEHPPEEMLALPSGDAESDTLCAQISMVKYVKNESGKISIEKKADLSRRGIASPDHAEALMLTFMDLPRGYDLAAAL